MVKVARMIEEPGHSAGHLEIPSEEETTMLKTISAALLAASVIAAPALANSAKTVQAPVAKTTPAANTAKVKPSAMNANAKMDRHHGRHHAKHHGSQKKMTSLKTHKVSSKPAAPAAKRG
jgi:hypothetical protein